MARNSKPTSAADREALNQLFGDFVEKPEAKPAHLESESHSTSVSEPAPARVTMNPLAKTYLANAVSNLTRQPSSKLKDDFRATLHHWRSLTIMALKTADEPTALVNVVLATVESEGTFDAMRLVRNVSQQLLWQASVDVQRDRRTASETTQSSFQDGMDTHCDADTVIPPSEDEAVDALVEAHGWLSTIADLLPNDDEDRARLGIDGGLEYTQTKQDDDTWVRVYSVNEAIDLQLAKNIESMKRRDGQKVLQRKDAFIALAKLAA